MPTVESLTKIASIIRSAREELCLDNLRAFADAALRDFQTNQHCIIRLGWNFMTIAQYKQTGVSAMVRSEQAYLDGKRARSGSSIVYSGD